MRAPLPAILLATISLPACASQSSPTPLVDLPTTFAAATVEAGGLRPARLEPDWWRAFGDPVLDSVVEGALLSNLDIEAAAARLQQAAGASRIATSNRLPSATFSASGSAGRQSLEDPLARIASASPDYDRNRDLYGLDAAASWELDLFGRLSAARRAAVSDQRAAAIDVEGARLSVAAEIASAYITARELETRVAIAQARARTSDEVLELIALRHEEGAASRLELEKARADAAASRGLLPLLEAGRDGAFNRIDLLSGRPPGHAAAVLGEGVIPAALAVMTDDGPASLLVRRPDVVAAQNRLAAADARLAEAVTAYYPRLTIQGLAGFLSSGLSGLISEDTLQIAGSAGLSGRLLDFGAARGGVDIAQGRTREAAAAYRWTVLRAASEAEDGFSRLARGNRHALELTESQAALARASATARTAYDLGGLSLRDALDAQRRLLEVEDAAAAARADASRATVRLFRVLGGGWSAGALMRASAEACPRPVNLETASCIA